MNRRWLFQFNVISRAVVVVVVALVACLFLGAGVGSLLDALYRSTGNGMIQNLYYFLSNYREVVIILFCLGSVFLFFGWIFAPVYQNITAILTDSLHITEDATLVTPQLPKSMQSLSAALETVNKELRLWRYTVREAEQRKDDLVVSLAHDLRTPLTSILGYLELIHDNPELTQETRQKYANTALRKANRMLSLVEELFEITRFNIGNIELTRVNVNAKHLLQQLVEEVMPMLNAKDIRLNLENQGLDEIFVDPEKMARVLDNVLHNAANYTPQGGEIEITLKKDEQERSCIQIANSGMDISQEALNRFFEKFYRADEARQTGSGGSGLGLAIAKNIVEAHGGSIGVQNRDNITTFTITI